MTTSGRSGSGIDTMAPVSVSSTKVKSPGPKPGRAPLIRSLVQTLNGSPDSSGRA